MFHTPDYITFEFIGRGARATTRTNCKACGKRIQWRGGEQEFFFGSNPKRNADNTWNTKSDFWRMKRHIPIKGCI